MREYWHVFAAYAVTILAIAGWVAALARRTSRTQRDAKPQEVNETGQFGE